MKKILLVSLIMLLAVSVAFSQLGIKGGINLGTVGGDDKSMGLGMGDPKAKMGIVGGISYKIGLILGLSIQPEVLYVQKGAIYELSMGGASVKATTKLDYVEIPVLVKFNLPIPVLNPYIEGGVSYGTLLSAKLKSEWNNVPGMGTGSEEEDIKDGIAKSDLSLIVGVGVELLILDINARYIMGTKKLDKDGLAKVYNRGIMLTAGIRF